MIAIAILSIELSGTQKFPIPAFISGNVGGALWEYANTFGSRSRAANRYVEEFSRAAEGQNVLLVYLLVFTLVMWLLCTGAPLAPPESALCSERNWIDSSLSKSPGVGDVSSSLPGIRLLVASRPQDASLDLIREPGHCSSWQRDIRKSYSVSDDLND